MSHILFELNCSYYSQVFFKNKYDRCFRSFSANELATKLRKLINIYFQNLLHTQDLHKQVYDKKIKL